MSVTKKIRPSEAIRRAYQRLAAAFYGSTLTLPQTAVLRALMQRGPMKQREIVGATGIDRSTLSETLCRMKADGVLAMVRMETDQRATMVTITPQGLAELRRNDARLVDAERALMKLVPSKDRAAFVRGLRAILEAE